MQDIATKHALRSHDRPDMMLDEVKHDQSDAAMWRFVKSRPAMAPTSDRLRDALKTSLDLAREWEAEAEAARKARHIEVNGDQNDEALIGHVCDLHAARACIFAVSREWAAVGGKP